MEEDQDSRNRIPASVKVGAKRFNVSCPHKFTEVSRLNGQCDFDLNEIRVKCRDSGGCRRPVENIMETFIHEVCHAVDDTFGSGLFGDDVGEDKLKVFAHGVLSFLVDNGYLDMGAVEIDYGE